MAESEQKPLLKEESSMGVPPPTYEPPKSEPNVPPPVYTSTMPLPTYTESEKYEREGVLEYENDSDCGEEQERSPEEVSGTGCEFTFFFLMCAMFSVVGFVFSFCLANTVAAQSGALAGLGVALVSKPLLLETYDSDHVAERWKENYCNDYWGYDTEQSVDDCVKRSYTFLRFFFWMVGVLGLYLLYKGVSSFFKSRSSHQE